MSQNLILFLSMTTILIIFILFFRSLTRGSLGRWLENEKYINGIPLKKEINWNNPFNEKPHRRGGLSFDTVKEKTVNGYHIYKVSISGDVGCGYIKHKEKEIFYKEKIEKESLPLYSTGIFGFVAMQDKK